MADLAGLNCRLCFSPNQLTDAIFPANDPDGTGPINKALIAQIFDCTSIRISVDRDYPCAICSSCVRIVGQFHTFRRKCLANEQKLRRSRGELEDGEQKFGGDQLFYQEIRQEVRGYLEDEVKKLKHKAFRMAMGEDSRSNDFRMMVDDEEEGEVNGIDWKNKYLTLQRNNELLQQAFKDQKEKMKMTEKLLKSSPKVSTSSAPKEETMPTKVDGFTKHPAIPGVKPSYLKALNENCEPGIKGDRQFITKLALAVFGEETLLNSSVTGKPSPKYPSKTAKPALCPQKMDAIRAKLFDRVKLEVGLGNQKELLARTDLKAVRLTLTQKLANMRKITRLPVAAKASPVSSSEEDDDEEDNEDNPAMASRE